MFGEFFKRRVQAALRKAELNFNLQTRNKVVHLFTTLFFLFTYSLLYSSYSLIHYFILFNYLFTTLFFLFTYSLLYSFYSLIHYFILFILQKSKKTLAQCLEVKIIKYANFSLGIKVHNIDIDWLIDMN